MNQIRQRKCGDAGDDETTTIVTSTCFNNTMNTVALSPTTLPHFSTASSLTFPLNSSAFKSSLLPPLLVFINSPKLNPRLPRKTPSLVVRAARTESKRVSLGFRAPDFELSEPLTGKTWTLQDFEAYPALLVMFICNHCPFVIHLKKSIAKLTDFYMKKGLAVVAISSNSVITHPQDGPEFMAEDAKVYGYPFPYLYDETQDVARDFGAVCTPEFLLFKKDGRRPFELVYHGQFDDSRPSNNVAITGRDLSMAIDSVLSGQPVKSVQKPSVGCSIKWHPEVKQ